MDSVDMFCVGDDRHRVALLEDFLVDSGMSVTLHARPLAEPSDPCLVACTARSLRTPWIAALFDADVSVVALRLDDTPLPGPCLRVINLQSWPARTADRKVGDLVGWLMRHGGGTTGGAQGADAHGVAAGGARRAARPRTSDTRRALLVLLLLVGGGALLFNLAPEHRTAREELGADDAGLLAEGAGVPAGTASADLEAGSEPAPVTAAGSPAVARAPDAGGMAEARAGAPAGSVRGSAAETDAPSRAGDAVDGSPDTGDPVVAVRALEDAAGPGAVRTVNGTPSDGPARATDDASEPSPVRAGPIEMPAAPAANDALTHLCAARSLAAARAWADALDWKQRRRARSEPCVARLLARPGYAPLRVRLQDH